MKPEADEQNTFADIVEAIDALETEAERHLSIQIDSSMRDAIQAAQSSGSSAAVTIVIKVKPGPDRRVGFAATVNAKLPRPPVAAVVLYADADGNVHKSDPAQKRLEFYDSALTRSPKES